MTVDYENKASRRFGSKIVKWKTSEGKGNEIATVGLLFWRKCDEEQKKRIHFNEFEPDENGISAGQFVAFREGPPNSGWNEAFHIRDPKYDEQGNLKPI